MAANEEQRPPAPDIVLGYVSGVFGVHGWVKLHSYTEPRDALLGYSRCELRHEGERREIGIADGRLSGKTLIAKLEGTDDPDAAARLKGAELVVPRAALPELPEGRYYWADLESLAVETSAGVSLGTVSHLLATGANDVLVVVEEGQKERLIPFVMGPVVVEVDLAGRRIIVDWEEDW